MEPTEAAAYLKPSKHRWYAACIVLVLSCWCMAIFEHALASQSPKGAMEAGEFLFGAVGTVIGESVVLAPFIAFLLALLFFFDGGFVKTVVAVGLSALTLVRVVPFAVALRDHARQTPAVTEEAPVASGAAQDSAAVSHERPARLPPVGARHRPKHR